ncbi:MAG: UDP-2,3-diacylglucosamine diphosphatase [Flavobacteriaceae bacterium]
MHKISLAPNKRIYFASDQHFGAPDPASSRAREHRFIAWLHKITPDCGALFLLGDLFDFWFEYDRVIPKGFVRVQGALAQIADRGIPLYFFTGNHDLWVRDYLSEELGFQVFSQPQYFEIGSKKFLIGHGDGLGPGDYGYKRMKKVFTFPLFQTAFKWLHPDLGVRFAQYLSLRNKLISGSDDLVFTGLENEWLVQYAWKKQAQFPVDYYLFGHRHLALDLPIDPKISGIPVARYLNTGDWITHNSYAVFDGTSLELCRETADAAV